MRSFRPPSGPSATVLDILRSQHPSSRGRPLGFIAVWAGAAAPPIALGLFVGLFIAGCAGASGLADANVPPVTRRYTLVTHESCDLTSDEAQREDANADGKPDVVTVSEGGTKVCQWLDFNFDGIGDTWVYFTPNGEVRRREVDYDRDGRIDETTNYLGSKIQERQRATTLVGKIDTWQYFEHGRLVRAERDANGDGIVDQWWEYPKTGSAECPLIHSDTDDDGRPDPGATVDLCAKDDGQQAGDQSFDEFDAPLSETVEDTAGNASDRELESAGQKRQAPTESKPAQPEANQ